MTSNARAGTRIPGSLDVADGRGIVRMQDRYDTDIDDLWTALTDPYRLARWIAEVHGGTLDVEESGPRGSTFRIQLPLNVDSGVYSV